MENFKPNSHISKQREEEKKNTQEKVIEKVTSGNVMQKKKTMLGAIIEEFIPGNARTIGDYIIMDVLLPALKRTISDMICSGTNMLFGESPTRNQNGFSPKRVNYRQYYRDDEPSSKTRDRASRSVYDYDNIIFDSRTDAEEVLYQMEEIVDRFDAVSVADLFDLSGITCNYTDHKYGWTDLRNTKVVRTRDGFILDLPKPTML